jgi:membrane protein DedA with SNARE-associated domain
MREWLIDNGIWGVALLMFLQNIIPLLPSEVIMPLAGFLASVGVLDLKGVVLAGLLGSLLGHLPWYFLGFALGEKRVEDFVARHGHWIRLRSTHIRKAGEWFDRNSVKAVLLGRLVPGLRTGVNIPAGTTRMAFLPYLIYTLIGDAVWTTLLAYGGFTLGRDYHLIASYMHLGVWILVAGIAALTVWMYIRHHREDGRTA